jgi:diaminopimelate epimerase
VVSLTGAPTIETEGGLVEGSADGAEVSVSMPEPRFGWDDIPLAYPMDTNRLPMAWEELGHPMALSVGNPHLVFFVDTVDELRLRNLGPGIESDPAFPDRINVNVARIEDEHRLTLRTWERGAGLTLACGSAACAAAVSAARTGRTGRKVTIDVASSHVRVPLTIEWREDNHVIMTGPAEWEWSGMVDPISGAWSRDAVAEQGAI